MKRLWSHPIPLVLVVAFELWVGLLLYAIASVVYGGGEFYAVNAWVPTLTLHPLALVATNMAMHVFSVQIGIRDSNVFAPAVSLSIFGGAQWYFLGVLVVWLYHRSRRASESDATCRRCGYDLTGNVSGVCPECGMAIPEDVRKRLAVKEAGDEAKGAVSPR